jgi:hypothetical protein
MDFAVLVYLQAQLGNRPSPYVTSAFGHQVWGLHYDRLNQLEYPTRTPINITKTQATLYMKISGNWSLVLSSGKLQKAQHGSTRESRGGAEMPMVITRLSSEALGYSYIGG